MRVLLLVNLMGANEQQMRSLLIGVGAVLIVLAAALAFGFHAWSKKHTVLGWFTRILAAIVGGLFGIAGSLFLDLMPKTILSATPDFIVVGSILACMIIGGWLAVRLVNFVQGRARPEAS